MVVIGTRTPAFGGGKFGGGLATLVVGSVAIGLLRRVPTPVVIVPTDEWAVTRYRTAVSPSCTTWGDPGEIVPLSTSQELAMAARCVPAATVVFMGPLLTSRRAVDLVRVGSALCCAAPGCPCPC